MKLIMISLMLIMSTLTYGKMIKDTNQLSEAEIRCFNSFSQNPIVKYKYPNLREKNAWGFVVQLSKYCNCEAKKLASDFEEKKKDWIAYSFKDKSKMLQKRDSCSLNSFYDDESLSLFYRARYEQWFSPQIISKIGDHVGASYIKMAVGQQKLNNYMECAHNIISFKCTRIKSLTTTYQCIKDSFDVYSYDRVHKQCTPHLSEPKTVTPAFYKDEGLII